MIGKFRKKISGKNDDDKFSIFNTFLSKDYQLHNVARLRHLDSLALPISGKRVLEFGAGIGDHTYYYLVKGCEVTSTDARQELLDFIKRRFNNTVIKLDVELDIDKIQELPKFDIIHCYGLLYHVSNPKEFLEAIRNKANLLLLETCVSSDSRESGPHVLSENVNNPTQSKSGKGCRPSRDWIYNILKELFPYVYMPFSQPEHAEFPKDWSTPLEDRNRLIRAIFIASSAPIRNQLLSESFVKNYH